MSIRNQRPAASGAAQALHVNIANGKKAIECASGSNQQYIQQLGQRLAAKTPAMQHSINVVQEGMKIRMQLEEQLANDNFRLFVQAVRSRFAIFLNHYSLWI
jgi:hypothetical protein